MLEMFSSREESGGVRIEVVWRTKVLLRLFVQRSFNL